MKNFSENLVSIPKCKFTVLVRVYNEKKDLLSIIPNIHGKQGSVQIFEHISDAKGYINFEAAKWGISLYGENLEDAKKNPGKHKNLELLIKFRYSSLFP